MEIIKRKYPAHFKDFLRTQPRDSSPSTKRLIYFWQNCCGKHVKKETQPPCLVEFDFKPKEIDPAVKAQ